MSHLPSRLRASGSGRGFTLLEICIVLLIMALLAAVALPSMAGAFTEQALRRDAHQLSLMVKTGMIKSGEQHRAYLLALNDGNILLQPAPAGVAESTSLGGPDLPSTASNGSEDASAQTTATDSDDEMTLKLTDSLKLPDAVKAHDWEAVPSVRWVFLPASLCPLPRVRLERGKAWIEMSFNALTGDVEDEATYIP